MAQRAAGVNYKAPLEAIRSVTQEEGLLVAANAESLRRLLSHAFRNVPYYHDLFLEMGVVSDGEIDPSKYPSLPILTKGAIRANSTRMTSADHP